MANYTRPAENFLQEVEPAYEPQESEILQVVPEHKWESFSDKARSDILLAEAGSKLIQESYDEGLEPEEARERLAESDLMDQIEKASTDHNAEDRIVSHFLAKQTSERIGSHGLVNISGKYGATALESQFIDESGYDRTPSMTEMSQFAYNQSEDEAFTNEVLGKNGDPLYEMRGSVDTEFVSSYVDFLRGRYEDIWGGAPRARGIDQDGVLSNQRDLLKHENTILGKLVDFGDTISEENMDKLIHYRFREEQEKGEVDFLMRPTQQWATNTSTASAFAGDNGGVVLRDSQIDTLLSTGAAGVGDARYARDIGSAVRTFDSDQVVLSEDYSPVEHAFWMLNSLE